MELLFAGVPDDAIPEGAADALVIELREAAVQTTAGGAEIPDQMQTLLQEIRDKLDEPGKSSATRLPNAKAPHRSLSSHSIQSGLSIASVEPKQHAA